MSSHRILKTVGALLLKETIHKRILIAGLMLATIAIGAFAQKPVNDAGSLDSVTPAANLYRDDADAKKEIEAALKSAVPTKKRILLVFGANWCYDCHVLDQALRQGDAGKIVSENLLLEHVDIGEGEKNLDLVKLYKIPLEKGVPALAVLERDGRLLYSSGQGEFEDARRMMKKDLIEFLRHWQTNN